MDYLAAGQPGKGVSSACLTPLTDGFDRSSVDESLFFVGVDTKVNGGMAMGMQGWSCAFRVAQFVGLVDPSARFTLDVLPERQRDIIAERHRSQLRRSLGVALFVVSIVAFTASGCWRSSPARK